MEHVSASEEMVAFNYELGLAIAQWGYVEAHLLRIATECVSAPDRSALAITYHSVANFRSKLSVCDNLVLHKYGKTEYIEKWRSALRRTSNLSVSRNTIAHGWHKLYINNKEGRRWAIVPIHQENGELINIDGEMPPPGAICLRDLVGIRLKFHSLTKQLCNVYEVLHGNQEPFPESHEPSESPPTLLQIINRIRAELGFPQKS